MLRVANPKVFLDTLLIGAGPVGSANKEVAALLVACRQQDLKTLSHRLLEPLTLLMIGPMPGRVSRVRSARTGDL